MSAENRKVVRDGKVAVLYSPGFGAGWASWSSQHYERMAFMPEVVALVEEGRHQEITEALVAPLLGVSEEDCPYLGGASDLAIEWVPLNSRFRITEYDGSESVDIEGCEDGWINT